MTPQNESIITEMSFVTAAEYEVCLGSCKWNSVRGNVTPFCLLALPATVPRWLRGGRAKENEIEVLLSKVLLLLVRMHQQNGRVSTPVRGPVLFFFRQAHLQHSFVPVYQGRRTAVAPSRNGPALAVCCSQTYY